MEAEICPCVISNHLRGAWYIALTHVVVGVLLFVFGILDRLYSSYLIERVYFAVFCGVMVSS